MPAVNKVTVLSVKVVRRHEYRATSCLCSENFETLPYTLSLTLNWNITIIKKSGFCKLQYICTQCILHIKLHTLMPEDGRIDQIM